MQHTNFKNKCIADFLEALGRKDPKLAAMVSFLLSRRPVDNLLAQGSDAAFINPLKAPNQEEIERLLSIYPLTVKNLETISWPIVDSDFRAKDYLPIRAFRSDTAKLWGAVDKLRIFLSSGTTSGPEGRSRSVFSTRGLGFYHASSIAAFLGVLERCVLPFSASFLNIVSLSLIPTVEEWPDSSLAQMISWFSEIWETHYASGETLGDVEAKLALARQRGVPIFIFGTAFHFVNLLEKGVKLGPLPEGSIVIETGGTKGRSRSVTRSELYELIAGGFGISPERIVSEYGMCELTSQAWDVVPLGCEVSLENRTFQFPWWVQVGVMTTPSTVEQRGVGALTIFDPLRCDILQHAIQTEDMAELFGDQSFKLRGRVPRAPLKGCSLRVSDVASTNQALLKTASSPKGESLIFSREKFSFRAPSARRWLLDLLSDREALSRLQHEFGCRQTALEAIVDLTSGLPFDAAGFARAAENSLSPTHETSQKWLFVAPSSHSVAMIYPLTLAFTAGLSVRLRLPDIPQAAYDQTFLARAAELAKASGFDLQLLPPSWKLGEHDLLDGESLLIFGDDETCSQMERFAPGRVASFGNVLSATLVTAKDFADGTSVRRMLRDQFSLGQRGCLSSRLMVSLGGETAPILAALRLAGRTTVHRSDENTAEKTARSMEVVRFSQLGFDVVSDVTGATFAAKKSRIEELSTLLTLAVSRLEYATPVILLPEKTDEIEIIDVITKELPVKALALGETCLQGLSKSRSYVDLSKDLRLVSLGSLGAPRLDGLHLGRRFFATRGSFTI